MGGKVIKPAAVTQATCHVGGGLIDVAAGLSLDTRQCRGL